MKGLNHARRALGLGLLAAALAGCASAPKDQFYTLVDNGAAAAPASGMYIEMRPPTVPDQVRRTQLVTGSGEGQVDLQEHHRWISKLDDQIGSALSLGVAAQLGAVDVYSNPAPSGAAVYRIGANVQRFESRLGEYALIDVVWSVRKVGENKVATCRSVFRETVGAGYPALVAGHRAALARLSARIADAVRSEATGQSTDC